MLSYYSEDVFSCIDPLILNNPFFYDWYEIVEEVLLSDEFQKRKLFKHHHNMSVWEHSIFVSFKAFLYGRTFNADFRVCALAGLLHDFYPWTWIYSEELEELDNGIYLEEVKTKHPLLKKHGFTHAKAASINYIKYFPHLENKIITNAIKRHMFPLNIVPPRYKESYIITIVDKINSVHELPSITIVPEMVVNKFTRRKRLNKKVIKEKI